MAVDRPIASFVDFTRACGITLTPAQAVLAAVGCDGVQPRDLEGDARELARIMFGAAETTPAEARRTLLVIKGARIGGSRIFGGVRLLHLALTVRLDGLAPGESAYGICVAPDMRLARQTLRFALGAAEHVPAIRSRLSNVSADSFALARDGGRSVVIEALPATRGGSAVRGRSLVGAVLSEAAFFRDESAVINDLEVFKGIAPRVLDGGAITIETTPWAQAGLAWELFSQNHGSPVTCIAAHAPTTLLRPDLVTRAIVWAERIRDSENARREFDAEWLTAGSGQFFDAAAIDAAVSSDPAPPCSIHAAGCDLGFVSDSSALVIAGKAGEVVYALDLLELRPEKGKPLVPSEVVATFAKMAKEHGAQSILADHHYLESAREAAGNVEIIAAPGGQEGKAKMHLAVKEALAAGRVKLPNHLRLVQQLKALQVRPVPGGGLSISSPRRAGGGHGDIASAAILAIFAALNADDDPNAGRIFGRVTSERNGGGQSRDILSEQPYRNPRRR